MKTVKRAPLYSWNGCPSCAHIGSADGYDVHRCGADPAAQFYYYIIGNTGQVACVLKKSLERSGWRRLIDRVNGGDDDDDDPSVSPNAYKNI